MNGRPWTEREIEYLRSHYHAGGVGAAAIAAHLGRQVGQVYETARRYGMTFRPRHPGSGAAGSSLHSAFRIPHSAFASHSPHPAQLLIPSTRASGVTRPKRSHSHSVVNMPGQLHGT